MKGLGPIWDVGKETMYGVDIHYQTNSPNLEFEDNVLAAKLELK